MFEQVERRGAPDPCAGQAFARIDSPAARVAAAA